MPVVFYFNIQIDFSFCVSDDFFQLRNLFAAEFFVESHAGIQLADLIVSQGPDAGVQSRCPLQVGVMQKDDFPIACLLHIDLRVVGHTVHCVFDRTHRVFRRFSCPAPVRRYRNVLGGSRRLRACGAHGIYNINRFSRKQNDRNNYCCYWSAEGAYQPGTRFFRRPALMVALSG